MGIIVGILIVLIVLIILRSTYENSHYEIEYKEIYSEKIKNDIKIVFFADMHNNVYGTKNDKLLNSINKFSPDIILIAGDLFVAKKEDKNENAMNLLRDILREYRVIYTFGNHESKLRNKDKYKYTIDCLKEFLNNDNFYLVNNKAIELDIKECVFQVAGYEADLKYFKKKNKIKPEAKEIQKIYDDFEFKKDNIKILLAHNPDFASAYAELDFDYIFSGHNHGGIVRLPFIGGVISTSYKIFPKYYGGEYNVGSAKMYVTRGLGSHTIRFRLFNKPQLHMFALKNK